MKSKTTNIVIFWLSFICLMISAKLIMNVAIFVDEFNTSPDVVFGGDIWLYMNYVKIALLFGICVVSGLNISKYNKQ